MPLAFADPPTLTFTPLCRDIVAVRTRMDKQASQWHSGASIDEEREELFARSHPAR